MRIYRQRENPLRLAFGHRELALAIAEIGGAAHGMDRPAIGDVAVDVALGEALQHAIAVSRVLDDVDIIGVAAVGVFTWESEPGAGKRLVVPRGDGATALDPALDAGQ